MGGGHEKAKWGSRCDSSTGSTGQTKENLKGEEGRARGEKSKEKRDF